MDKKEVIVNLGEVNFHFHQNHFMTLESADYFVSKLNEEFLYSVYKGKEALINDFVAFIESLHKCKNPIVRGVAKDFSKQIKREGTYFVVLEVGRDVYFNFENPHKKDTYIYGMKFYKRKRLDK